MRVLILIAGLHILRRQGVGLALELRALLDEAREDACTRTSYCTGGGKYALGARVCKEGLARLIPVTVFSVLIAISVSVLAMSMVSIRFVLEI